MRALVVLFVLLVAVHARATGYGDYGRELGVAQPKDVRVDGYFRVRGDALYNLDLDRGATPSGELFYPVPIDDPKGQLLTRADMRLRTDLAFYSPGGMVAVKVRLDTLDNLSLGSAPDGIPAASGTQRSDGATITVKRAWGEALTPIGLLAAGRMGSHWGLGMLTNGGDCLDCDSGDAADRIAFVTPLVGHLWAVSYDFSATGPFVPSRGSSREIDVLPSASAHTLTFAALRYKTEAARRRRAKAGKSTPEYGAYVSHRWQNEDVPATYLAVAQPVAIDSGQVMTRGYRATALDGWARLGGPGYRVEAEVAYLMATVDQPSLIPGVRYREAATSKQLGAALESEVFTSDESAQAGLDAGYASGDSAPGFGAFPRAGATAAQPGDLDGPQAAPPTDTTVNNFRFHPDYRIDRILFREIIGTVTDAVYVRPHGRVEIFRVGEGKLEAEVALVASWAVNPESAPGRQRALGIEIDPTLHYRGADGFDLALEHATLFPQAGLDNPELGMSAQPAQLWRARVAFVY